MERIAEIDYQCTNIAPIHTLLHRDVEYANLRSLRAPAGSISGVGEVNSVLMTHPTA